MDRTLFIDKSCCVFRYSNEISKCFIRKDSCTSSFKQYSKTFACYTFESWNQSFGLDNRFARRNSPIAPRRKFPDQTWTWTRTRTFKSNVLAYDFRHVPIRFSAPRHCHLQPLEQKRPKSRPTPWTRAGRWNWNEIPSLGRSPAAVWIIIGR